MTSARKVGGRVKKIASNLDESRCQIGDGGWSGQMHVNVYIVFFLQAFCMNITIICACYYSWGQHICIAARGG